MNLKLHTYANGDLYMILKPENKTEEHLIEFCFGQNQTQNPIKKACADSLNGISLFTNIKTDKKY